MKTMDIPGTRIMERLFALACAVALVLATADGVMGQTASPEEIRRLEQEIRAAEGARQRAEDRRVQAQRAFEKARLNMTQLAQRVAAALTKLSEEQAKARALPDSEQKAALLKTLGAKEAALRQELAKARDPVVAAQKERSLIRADIDKALAAEKEAKAKLAILKGGAPIPVAPTPATPPPPAPPPASKTAPLAPAAKAAPAPPAAAPAAAKASPAPPTATRQEALAMEARANREKWEKTLRAISTARLEIEALTVNDEERLRAQIQEAAANRAKIEQLADSEKKAKLLAQLSELENKLKAEFEAVTAQVNDARRREAAAKAEYDKAVAAEQEALKRSAATKSGR
jgi:hypothetical protein